MIIVLIAAYNEEAALPSVLEHLPEEVMGHTVRTVVLSDGSTDGTVRLAREFGAEVIEFDVNRGKGAVLKSGLTSVEGDPYSALVLMDADGQHDPTLLEELVSPVLDRSADVVVGSRYLLDSGRGDASWNRYVVRSAIQAALGVVLTTSVTDPFSGYRCFGRDAAACMELSGDRYESELEMLFCADRHSLSVMEVAMPKLYSRGTSKMGARYGSILGRIDVVSRYVLTVIRESARSARFGARRERVSA